MFVVRSDRAETAPDIWQALADPTRRQLIDRLAGGPKTTSELCANLPMTRFGVMKHLGVLEQAGLVTARRQGRLRLNHLNAAPLALLQARWLSARGGGLARLAGGLAEAAEEQAMADAKDGEAAGVLEVALDWTIAASVQRVWRTLFDAPEAWWPTDFRAAAGARMRFDERLGGALREERPDGSGLLWYRLIAFEPMRSLDLSGQIAARYGGPATSLLHLELVPAATEGATILKLTDSLVGRIGDQLRESVSGGWQSIFGAGLKAHLEQDGRP